MLGDSVLKPVMQTIFNGDVTNGDVTGDCMSASIASIFELPLAEVPNFSWLGRCANDPTKSDWWYLLRDWLAPRGFMYFDVPADGAHEDIVQALGYHLISGKSPRGDWTHTVVGKAGQIVHDPHPDGTGLRTVEMYGVFVALDPRAVPAPDCYLATEKCGCFAGMVMARRPDAVAEMLNEWLADYVDVELVPVEAARRATSKCAAHLQENL
jgi:hypothetical protein